MSAVVHRVNFGLSAESLLQALLAGILSRRGCRPHQHECTQDSWKDRIFWLQKFATPRRWPGAAMEQD
jgi:hypothetical protein